MKINLKITTLTLSDEESVYLDKRLQALDKLVVGPHAEAAMADVEVGRTTTHHQGGAIFRAEINLHVGSKHLRSVSEKTDLLSAIDDAKDQMAEELRSTNSKQLTLMRRGAKLVKDTIRGFYR